MRHILLTLALLLPTATLLHAQTPKLVAVLPLDVRQSKMQEATRVTLEENIRTIAGEALLPLGYTVLTGETTLAVLSENGIDPEQACDTSCALDTAREMNTELFISGTVTESEGFYHAFVRLFESRSGKQLGALALEGRTVREINHQLREEASEFFFRLLAPSKSAGANPAPPPVSVGSGPVIRSGELRAALGDVIIDAQPRKGVRLEVEDPEGKKVVSGSPYKNAQAKVGTWKVLAQAAGYEEERREFMVGADVLTPVQISLKPLGGLSIVGEPKGAAVTVTGPGGFEHTGALPWEAEGIRSGNYRVVVVRPSYRRFQQDVEVKPGETGRVEVALERATQAAGIAEHGGGMIRIPGGSFDMDSATSDRSNEKPVTRVTLSTYDIDKTQVTLGAYRQCVNARKCEIPRTVSDNQYCNWGQSGKEQHPINCVNWFQAKAYCEWRGARLPTEAEWEYAAKGSDGRKYPWGNQEPGSRACWNRSEGTCVVGSYPAGNSPFGVQDMAGNVWEWVGDWYANSYPGGSVRNPTGPSSGSSRVLRGGSWISRDTDGLRAGFRFWHHADLRDDYDGFRCARGAVFD